MTVMIYLFSEYLVPWNPVCELAYALFRKEKLLNIHYAWMDLKLLLCTDHGAYLRSYLHLIENRKQCG